MSNIPSVHQITGLSFEVTNPRWVTNVRPVSLFGGSVTSWEHEIDTDGGFKYGKLVFAASQTTIEEWLEGGLGRNVRVFNASGVLVWEGFVNTIKGSVGTVSITRGPLMYIANRVLVAYRPYVDICVDPPTQGDPTFTTLVEDTISQEYYGIQEDIVSGGTLIDDTTFVTCDGGEVAENEAEMIRDTYLQDMKLPMTGHEVTLGNTSDPKIELGCLGYYEWLDRYPYVKDFEHYITIPDKIEAILGDDPNGIISDDYSNISHDTSLLSLTHDGESDYKTAKTIIEELVSYGDANAKRTYFAILEDRAAHYNVMPDNIAYFHKITSNEQIIRTPAGAIVDPWDVRPTQWVFFSDFMPGRVTTVDEYNDKRYDPRYMFIESVRYSTPNSLRLVGSKVDTLQQLLARKGVGV